MPPSTLRSPIVYASNQDLTYPCTIHRTKHSFSADCNFWPVGRLQPDGVVIGWWSNGSPAWSFQRVQGESLSVDGRPAKLDQSSTLCGTIGGTGFSVVIPNGRDNWLEFDACAETNAGLAQARAVLDSTRLTSLLPESRRDPPSGVAWSRSGDRPSSWEDSSPRHREPPMPTW